MLKRLFLTAAFGLLFVCSVFPQEDFEKIFSKDYAAAMQFIAHESWMTSRIEHFGLPPKAVLAIIFPEIIRFGAIQDKIEVFALESLYIKFGKDYANFSIGRFQVKPSFAESLEKDMLKYSKQVIGSISSVDTLETETSRANRIKRLQDIHIMLDYICYYYKLMNAHYPHWPSDEEKIKFMATAYNCGYQKSRDEINSFVKKKFFYIGLMTTTKYAYADVSWHFYGR